MGLSGSTSDSNVIIRLNLRDHNIAAAMMPEEKRSPTKPLPTSEDGTPNELSRARIPTMSRIIAQPCFAGVMAIFTDVMFRKE